MSPPPLNLTAHDFDAYAPEKATSNAYSRPRLEVKQRALAWARVVTARLAELGLDVDVHASDEHPSLQNKKRVDCQWVFFWREPAARDELGRLLDRGRSIAAEIEDPSPVRRHAFLALRIDVASVDVCFAVHPEAQVDVENLRACLASGDGAAAELMAALRALPEQFSVALGEAGGSDRVAAGAVTPDALRELVERACNDHLPLWIGWSVGRDQAAPHAAVDADHGAERSPTLDEQLEGAVVALAPVYRLVAWARDNDLIALDRRMVNVEEERARAHAEAEAQTERWRHEQAEAQKSFAERARPRPARDALPPAHGGRPTHRPTLDDLFAPRKPGGREALAGAPTGAPRARVEAAPVAPIAPIAAPLHAVASPPSIEKGSKVRVLSGPFADKVGVIGELDGRGGARVLLGLLSTRVDLAGLEPVLEGRERPPLQSSHTRPLPPAPRKARG